MAVLAIGGDDRIARLERRHDADRDRLLAVIEVQEASDLLLRVQLDALSSNRRMRIICRSRSSRCRA